MKERQGGGQLVPDLGDGAAADDIDAGQGLPDVRPSEGPDGPVGEIVGRFGRLPEVLLQKAMGVMVDRGLGDTENSLVQIGQGTGPAADDLGESERDMETESNGRVDIHDQTSFLISLTILPAQR